MKDKPPLARRLTTSLIFILVVAIALWAAFWFSDQFGIELDNRYLVRNAAKESAEILDETPDLDLAGIKEATLDQLSRRREYRSKIQDNEVGDFWDGPPALRLSKLESGEFEWRSAGKDRQWDSDDDRFARFRAGIVTLSPLKEKE